MIQANELRVGNWVYDSECEPHYFQVEQLTKYVGSELWIVYRNGSIKAKKASPIHLTEEILLKIKGISVSKTNRNRFCLNGYEIYIFRNKDESIDKIIFSPTDVIYSVKINSLHHLQNLYFALTNKELEIEL